MQNVDVIIILGGDVGKHGELSSETINRLDTFLLLKGDFLRIPVVVSGRGGGFTKDTLTITGAKAMKTYLVEHGISTRQIYLEYFSLDTISNAIFSRRIVERHVNWKRVGLLTSDFHMPRALWIFRKVFGKGFHFVAFQSVSESVLKTRNEAHEQYLLPMAKQFLKNAPADTVGLVRLLRRAHPFYSRSRKAKDFLAHVVEQRKKVMSTQ